MAAPMLQLTSTGAVVDQIAHARHIAAEAYTLHGPILFALEEAARRGAGVRVRLEGRPFDDPKGRLAAENARLAGDLRACGAEATLTHPLHAKALDLDGVLYLDEKNWRRNDLVLRENDATEAGGVATSKHEALSREAQLLDDARRGDDAVVESESFGCCNAVYGALSTLGRDGASPRLLVAQRELRGNKREAGVLEKLVNDGVRVRVCKDSEKLAVAGSGAWLGSANATAAFGESDMIDWGLCTSDPAIVSAVRTRLEAAWDGAAEFKGRKG
jgi:hypothetical protein